MEKKLEVRNLRISFRTNNGTVKAVRGINFTLHKGETLAIVGESGSGKSVTSRAILGIQAANKIVEGGEIIYDGKDLLKIDEDEFHKIRGSKISMIFQDPLSSLDPIMKIGKQMTEAMILKGKANQKDAKSEYNKKLAYLLQNTTESVQQEELSNATSQVKHFSNILFNAAKDEKDYNIAYSSLVVCKNEAEQILQDIRLIEYKNTDKLFKEFLYHYNRIYNKYIISNNSNHSKLYNEIVKAMKKYDKTGENVEDLISKVQTVREIYDELCAAERPNFFAIAAYNLGNNGKQTINLSENISSINEKCLVYLNENFLSQFKKYVILALKNAHKKSYDLKKQAIDKLNESKSSFSNIVNTQKEINSLKKEIVEVVENSINQLEITKDSISYTFNSSLTNAISSYFKGVVNNPKEEARYQKEVNLYNKNIAANKIAVKAVPPSIIDLGLVSKNIVEIIERAVESYEHYLDTYENINYDEEYKNLINHLTNLASASVYKVTNSMAKIRALELMKEVGIPEPRKRFYQYPFEFSGGMRQRIVIAIALASNPDVLICDEPTTALDVTIQAQILELINKLKKERQLSIIFITHDLGVVANMADKIAVMYAGKIVEYGSVDEIFYDPKHPYTWALLSSMPDLNTKEKLEAIPGTPPNMIFPPKGDAFAARNKYAMKIDFEEEPPLFEVTPTHYAATWLLHPDAPKVVPPKIVTERIERMKNMGGVDNE